MTWRWNMDRKILADELESMPWVQRSLAALLLCVLVILSAVLSVFGLDE